MKKIVILLALFSVIAAGAQTKSGVNFSDINKWQIVLKDKTVSPAEIFSFNEGILTIGSKTTGYLRTKKKYSNYTLGLEWRWTKKLGNGGVLLHIQSPDSVWPVCYQVQQKFNAVGDLICMNGLKANECTDNVKFTVPKRLASNEKPVGEWNTMLVYCKGDKITVYCNGELQNEITGLTVSKGFVGFQAEGGMPMEVRNIHIK